MIDSSIALSVKPVQIESPMNALAQALQMQQGMQNNQLGQLKLDEYARTKDRSNKLVQLMQNVPIDASIDQRMNVLRGSGYFEEADKLQTGQLSRQKTTSEADAKNIETAHKKIDLFGQSMAFVKQNPTPENAIAALNQLAQFGVVTPEQVNQYKQQIESNPSSVAQLAEMGYRSALNAKDQLPQLGDVKLGGTTQLISRNPVTGEVTTNKEFTNTQSPDSIATNATSRANNSATVGATLRGQDLTANTAANSLAQAKEAALKANKEDKLTEDQGKATGWLVQAENGYKNIQDALKKDPSASKRGINDTISDIPSFGAGAALGNSMRGTERQKFIHGVDVISEALLRAATGAGVNETEAAQKVRELTPQIGDSDELVKQKMDSIPLYIETLKVRAGGGAKKAAQVLSNSNLTGSNPTVSNWSK